MAKAKQDDLIKDAIRQAIFMRFMRYLPPFTAEMVIKHVAQKLAVDPIRVKLVYERDIEPKDAV